ncbi:MAG TPA: hypothetical protein VFN02_17170, partial [Ktedonobacteraceae bacterium]|nr:hypothetical protein [Ktedonobacteraceae bacterium]
MTNMVPDGLIVQILQVNAEMETACKGLVDTAFTEDFERTKVPIGMTSRGWRASSSPYDWRLQ